jgi:hypothetical protein
MHPQQPQPYPVVPVVPVSPVFVAPVKPPTSGLAIASLVLGIVGALCGWCLLGIPCLLAVIFGHLAIPATRPGRQAGRGAAVAGLVLGYLMIVPAVILTITGAAGSLIQDLEPDPAATVTSCVIDDETRTARIGVTATNKTRRTASYRVQVVVKDANGVRVGDGSVWISDIAAGQTAAGTGMAVLDVPGGKTCAVGEVS